MWSHRRTILGSLFSEQILKEPVFSYCKEHFKGDLLCPFLQYVIQVSGVPRICLWSFSSKYLAYHILYHFENAYFEWKQTPCCFHACLFKCKWAAAPRPLFQKRAVFLQLRYSAINMFDFDYHVCHAEIILNFWYTVFWAHTSEAYAQKASVVVLDFIIVRQGQGRKNSVIIYYYPSF